jgi:hypothetical protein
MAAVDANLGVVPIGPNLDDAQRPFSDFLTEQWVFLCTAMAFPGADIRQSRAALLDLISPWADASIGRRCRYRSYVSADGFPAELSLSWRAGRPEVRILFESLSPELTGRAAQDAGRRLTRRLATKPGVDLGRYLAVEDLFVTDEPTPGTPTIWHSLAWRRGHAAKYKVYLNPCVHGQDGAADVVGSAMSRIGMGASWHPVAQRCAELADRGHTIEFFALDLERPDVARVKVYFRHGPVTLTELDTVASLARHHSAARARRVYRACYGGGARVIDNEPITCLAFRADGGGPEEANVYMRLRHSEYGLDPVARVLNTVGVGVADYMRLLNTWPPDVPVTRELLSFRTVGRGRAAEIGLYLRFPQHQWDGASDWVG